jgi:hypothetical protein
VQFKTPDSSVNCLATLPISAKNKNALFLTTSSDLLQVCFLASKEAVVSPPTNAGILFFKSHIEGGVHTGSTQHVGHFWHIVSDPCDCEDGEFGGMKIGRGNQSTRRKCFPRAILSTLNPIAQELKMHEHVRPPKPLHRVRFSDMFIFTFYNLIL